MQEEDKTRGINDGTENSQGHPVDDNQVLHFNQPQSGHGLRNKNMQPAQKMGNSNQHGYYPSRGYQNQDMENNYEGSSRHSNKKKSDFCFNFQKDECTQEKCPLPHIYKSCPFFDQGFCPYGQACDLRHITRKLCLDYMYGFCPEGPNCEKAHPNFITGADVEFTKNILPQLRKGTQPLSKENLKIIQCYNCCIFGHKKPQCKENQIKPTDQFLCGLCEKKHAYNFNCQLEKQAPQEKKP